MEAQLADSPVKWPGSLGDHRMIFKTLRTFPKERRETEKNALTCEASISLAFMEKCVQSRAVETKPKQLRMGDAGATDFKIVEPKSEFCVLDP